MNFLDVGQEKDIYADGIHDDTKALQACLDKAKEGGTIYFPDGTYLISAALIFYSDQCLLFSDNAVLLRSAKSEKITKYMLASHSEPDVGGYGGTHDVVISGGIFDGNAELTEKLTIINTVHCSNIIIKNCRFRHVAYWHCIEINSTKHALVTDCVFDGPSYTAIREELTSELLQVDAAAEGAYGPVYNCDGELIAFAMDETPCCDIKIVSCIFKCDGFPAVGHHADHEHRNIEIKNNIFTGCSGKFNNSRGYITFMPKVHDVRVMGNAFISPAEKDVPNIGIIANNAEEGALTAEDNTFIGTFSTYFKGGISERNNRNKGGC